MYVLQMNKGNLIKGNAEHVFLLKICERHSSSSKFGELKENDKIAVSMQNLANSFNLLRKFNENCTNWLRHSYHFPFLFLSDCLKG